MPPSERPVPSFMAEPPQEGLPYGRWGDTLAERFRAACRGLPEAGEAGDPGDVAWFPDRTFSGRTYVPATAAAPDGSEYFGFVSYLRPDEGSDAEGFEVHADLTSETAGSNPGWRLDLSDHVIGAWRGAESRQGEITLVWGVSLVRGGVLATAELGPTTTDQCELAADRFTLVSLDDYTGDLLEVRVWGPRGDELAAESLYEDDE